MQIMSFTFIATQSMPTVSHRRISFATRTFVPTLSVQRESAWDPKSTRPEVADLREGFAYAFPSIAQGSDEGGDVRRLLVLAHAGLRIGADHAQATERGYFKGTRAEWLTC